MAHRGHGTHGDGIGDRLAPADDCLVAATAVVGAWWSTQWHEWREALWWRCCERCAYAEADRQRIAALHAMGGWNCRVMPSDTYGGE